MLGLKAAGAEDCFGLIYIGDTSAFKKLVEDAQNGITYDDLRLRYDDGTWDRAAFADRHILFQERGSEYDYMKILLGAADQRFHLTPLCCTSRRR